MNKLIRIYAIGLTGIMTVVLFASFYGKESTGTEAAATEDITTPPTPDSTYILRLPQVITAADLSKDFTFAGELVPKDNFDAMERLDRELLVNSYWHSNTLINLKSSSRYFPVIEQILRNNNVPDDFKYLAVAESNLRNETSPAGAKGVWQFMKGTGEQYGLEINGEVDERLHLEKSTEAACKYLKDYYGQFGSWALAAAAYNMGGPKLKKLLEEQKAKTYYDLNLNSETSRYFFRLIAIKEIMQNPQTFGFYLNPKDAYAPFEYSTVSVDSTIASLGEFALQHGTSYRMLKVFNPWLIDSSLSNKSKKSYEIKIPR